MRKIATRDKMVEAIKEAEKPFLTKGEIADALGVSWQTIDNNEENLLDDSRVATGEAGQATVYYPAEIDELDDKDGDSDELVGDQGGSYHLFERAAFYTGFASVLFSLLLSATFVARLSVGAIAQGSISPTIPAAYYAGLAIAAGLLAFSGVLLRMINSGVLRGWTRGLDREEVETRIQAAKSRGLSWTLVTGVGYLAAAIVTGVVRTQVSGVLADALLWVAVVPLLAFFAVAAFTVVMYALLATHKAYDVYMRVQSHLPESNAAVASDTTTHP
jgi:hypothetical protein